MIFFDSGTLQNDLLVTEMRKRHVAWLFIDVRS